MVSSPMPTSFLGSHLTTPWSKRGETLAHAGHVSPRIWEMTIKLLKGWVA